LRLRLDLCDVDVQLKINGWRESKTAEEWDDNWCDVELYIHSDYLQYDPSGEIIMSSEVLWLRDTLKKLIANELEEDCIIEFAEPDLQFDLRIAKRLYSIPGKVIYPKGYHDVDIDGDMIIHFWCKDGLGSNSFSMGLDREDITNIYNYLMYVTDEIKSDDSVIVDMLKKGTMLPE